MYCYRLGDNNFQCDIYRYNGYNVYVWSKLYPLGWSQSSYVGFYYGMTYYAYRYVTGNNGHGYSCYTIEDLGKICMKLKEINNENDSVICFKVTTSTMRFSGTKCFRRTRTSSYEFCALEDNIKMLDRW
ncbi:uncharacterized protein [Rhodnius prolixus]|uniref:uncharacterized protein n=1 Tax=Rhodnius prolixus TaxID=13249 RepID=UPI003D18F6AC